MTRVILKGYAAALLGVVLISAGCTSEGKSAQAKVATKAVTSVQETREELVKADQQVDETLVSMDRLATAPADLPHVYDTFSKEVSETSDQSDDAQERADEMRARWRDYVAAWEKEIDRLTTPELQAGAVERRATVRQNYDRLREAARALDAAYEPFVARLEDIRRALSLDLTPAGVEAAQPAFEVARKSGTDLKEQISAFIADLDEVSATAPGQPVGSAATSRR